MVSKFSVTLSISGGHFKVLKRLILKHLGDSWDLQDGFMYKEKCKEAGLDFLKLTSSVSSRGTGTLGTYGYDFI